MVNADPLSRERGKCGGSEGNHNELHPLSVEWRESTERERARARERGGRRVSNAFWGWVDADFAPIAHKLQFVK